MSEERRKRRKDEIPNCGCSDRETAAEVRLATQESGNGGNNNPRGQGLRNDKSGNALCRPRIIKG